MSDYLKNFDNCLEGSIPYCAGACPFNMDVLNFIEKARRGSAKAAFNVYRNAVGFPRIVSRLCPQPCREVCPRKDSGGSIKMLELERAAIALTANTAATDYNLPPKKERIAIIGAGAAGVCALLRLSTKKYHVEVFEKTDSIGGYLRSVLDSETIDEDFREQLEFQDYILHLNTEIKSADELKGKDFDAVLVATGEGGEDFGLINAVSAEGDKYCSESDETGWFAAGALTGKTLIESMANGLHMGTVIDNYLKTGHQYYPDGNKQSSLCEGMVSISDTVNAIEPSAKEGYNKEEFAAEASRCAECKCSYCMQHCDICDYSAKWPLRIKDEVIATTLEGKTELKATPARRLMSLCNQCGLCREVCPEDIDMDELFMTGRRKMFRQDKMPWAFHDFFLRDMEQANEEAALIRKPLNPETGTEYEKCTYAFFPGCQLGAAEPEIVVKAYASLLYQQPDTAIFLQCCGMPVEWAGDEEGADKILADIHENWKKLGNPVMVMACMNCYKKFKEKLPDIQIISLYELLLQLKISGGCNSVDYSIFNPCSARHEDGVRSAVKQLAEDMGATLHLLEENEQYAKCCGYGGHGSIADSSYEEFVAKKRISEGQYPYITYCINCRDVFKSNGKNAVHILELIFGMGESNAHMVHEHDHNHDHADNTAHEASHENGSEKAANATQECETSCEKIVNSVPLPTVTERQRNRLELKQALLSLFWNEAMDIEDDMFGLTLIISDELKEKLNKKRILEKEIAEVIDFCLRTGRTILNSETGTLTGYTTVGKMTYWVEYRPVDEEKRVFEVVNAYSHRLKIELEAVWNGIRKADEM